MFNHAEILIVDDHEAIRRGIRSLLQSRPQWHVCGEAVDGVDAVEKVKTLHPDVVLMDISMPRMDGIAAMRIVQHESPDSRVIIVTQNDAASIKKESVRADGYVLKVHLHRDLLPTIDRVLASDHGGNHGGNMEAAATAPAPARTPRPAGANVGVLQPQSAGLAAIVSSSDDAVISKDLSGTILSWNEGARRIFGYTADEMVGRSMMRLIPPERQDEERDLTARIRRGERIESFDTVRMHKDGSRVDVSMAVSPLKDEAGRVIGASNQARDITEGKRNERSLALLASIVNSSEDAIASKTLEGIVTTWNPGAERLFGYRADEMIGQPITKIIPPERRSEEDAILAQLRRGENVAHFETVRRRKDGSHIDVSVTMSPVRDSNGRVIGASKIARDITVRKQIERALVASEQRLRTIAEELESTVDTRTRELERRNAEIMEQAEQLHELSSRLQEGQDAERRRIARALHDSAGQLLAVLGLNLGQMRARIADPDAVKAIEHSEEIVDQLNSEIRTMSYLLHPPLLDESGLTGAIQWYARGLEERGGFEIALDMPGDFRRLPQDLEVAMFRIVQECLTNIHRHSGSKTAAIRIQCTEDSCVRLEVQDAGRGIPPDMLANLHRHCVGVGIAGIRERVRHFGGEMRIDSGPEGTTVLVVLPIPHDTVCENDERLAP